MSGIATVLDENNEAGSRLLMESDKRHRLHHGQRPYGYIDMMYPKVGLTIRALNPWNFIFYINVNVFYGWLI